MNVIRRNNVKILGEGKPSLIFAHGFGCDQSVWQHLLSDFMADFQIILFDLAGSGNSDLTTYDRVKYGTLHGYANDLIEMCEALELKEVVFVGHSVSAIIGALAAIKRNDLFKKIIMVAPSPYFINEGDYSGGHDRASMNQMLNSLENDFMDWAKAIAPLVMGNLHRPDLSDTLFQSFCRTRPDIAKHFAQVTFLADHRSDMSQIRVPTVILQCSQDSLAPLAVGEFLRDSIPESQLVVLKATGHCPHLSAPEETALAIKTALL